MNRKPKRFPNRKKLSNQAEKAPELFPSESISNNIRVLHAKSPSSEKEKSGFNFKLPSRFCRGWAPNIYWLIQCISFRMP